MNTPSLKQRFHKGETTVGSWIMLADTAIAEIMASAGFDWLTVDMEHSAITLDHAREIIRVIQLHKIPALVRVGVNDATLIKQVMDAGADGVIVPMVNTAEDARRAVEAVHYPPKGKRGVGLSRAQGYGSRFEEYKEWLDQNAVVIVQIEHHQAISNLEEIMKVGGVDAFIVGPYDISGSVGHPGEFEHPKVVEQFQKIETLIRKNPSWMPGFHAVPTDPEKLLAKHREKYRFLAYSFDALFLADNVRNGLQAIRKKM